MFIYSYNNWLELLGNEFLFILTNDEEINDQYQILNKINPPFKEPIFGYFYSSQQQIIENVPLRICNLRTLTNKWFAKIEEDLFFKHQLFNEKTLFLYRM